MGVKFRFWPFVNHNMGDFFVQRVGDCSAKKPQLQGQEFQRRVFDLCWGITYYKLVVQVKSKIGNNKHTQVQLLWWLYKMVLIKRFFFKVFDFDYLVIFWKHFKLLPACSEQSIWRIIREIFLFQFSHFICWNGYFTLQWKQYNVYKIIQ